jgi:hypothetical protein
MKPPKATPVIKSQPSAPPPSVPPPTVVTYTPPAPAVATEASYTYAFAPSQNAYSTAPSPKVYPVVQSQPSIIPLPTPAVTYTAPAPPVAEEEPSYTYSFNPSQYSSTSAATSTSSYMAGLGGTAAMKSSYGVSKWSPKTESAGGSGIGSYLNNMSSGSSYREDNSLRQDTMQQFTTSPSIAPEYATAPVTFATSSTIDNPMFGETGSSIKSYSMSKWSPNRGETNTGTGSSYLQNMSAGTTSGAPSSYSMTPPSYPTASGAGTSKKSYSMSKWSPQSNAGGIAGAGSSYLEQMSRPTTSSYAESSSPPSSYTTTAALTQPSYTTPSYASTSVPNPMYGSTSSGTSKKSYSMSKWSPQSNAGGSVGGGSTYLEQMSTTSSYAGSSSPPSSYTTTAASTQPSYTTPSYASTYVPNPMYGSTSSGTSKKSYSMSKWSPQSDAGGSVGGGSTYLEQMSRPTTSSYAGSSSPPSYATTRTTAVPKQPSYTTPSFASTSVPNPMYASTISGSIKKSYSMSKWSPQSNAAAIAGVGSSYLEQMSIPTTSSYATSSPPSPYTTTAVPTQPSYTPPSYSSTSVPNPMYGSTSSGTSKKSYSMSKWSPQSNADGIAGVGSSYLEQMSIPTTSSYAASSPPSSYSTTAASTQPSYTPPSYSSTSVSSPMYASTSSGTSKKSYSMSKWSPQNNFGSAGVGSSHLEQMSGPITSSYKASSPPSSYTTTASPSQLSYTTASYAPTSVPNIYPGTSKKSYSMSKWSPQSNAGDYPGVGSSYLQEMRSSNSGNYEVTPSSTSDSLLFPSFGSFTETSSGYGSYSSSRPSYPTVAVSPERADYISPSYSSSTASSATSSATSKKSYSMSKWSLNKGSGNTGIGDSYLHQVSTSTFNGAPSVYTLPRGSSLPSPTYSPQSYDTSSRAFISSNLNGDVPVVEGNRESYSQNSDISPNAPPSYAPLSSYPILYPTVDFPSIASLSNGRKKSYSTSKWTPGNPRTTGTGDSYLDQL